MNWQRINEWKWWGLVAGCIPATLSLSFAAIILRDDHNQFTWPFVVLFLCVAAISICFGMALTESKG